VLGLVQLSFNLSIAVGDDDVTRCADVDAVDENAAPVDVLLLESVDVGENKLI
jgi:hypothetical protein